MSIYETVRRALHVETCLRGGKKSDNADLQSTIEMLGDNRAIFYFGSSRPEAEAMLAACGMKPMSITQIPGVDNLFLPRDPCAIEDASSCVVIEDNYVNQVGVDKPRTFLDIQTVTPDKCPNAFLNAAPFSKSAIFVCKFEYSHVGEEHCILPQMVFFIPHGGEGVFIIKPPLGSDFSALLAMQATKAIQEIAAINSPANIVVEHREAMTKLRDGRTVKVDQMKKRPRGSRPISRIRYLVLPKRKAHILVTGAHSEAESVQRCPHVRRRHLRYLGSERFNHKRGETIIVRESWIGPTERRDEDGTVWRVVLDMGFDQRREAKQATP